MRISRRAFLGLLGLTLAEAAARPAAEPLLRLFKDDDTPVDVPGRALAEALRDAYQRPVQDLVYEGNALLRALKRSGRWP